MLPDARMTAFAAGLAVALGVGASLGAAASPLSQAPVQPPPPVSAPAGDAGRGQLSFTKIGCYQCHGRQAQGGAG